jgi:hypothetical protein
VACHTDARTCWWLAAADGDGEVGRVGSEGREVLLLCVCVPPAPGGGGVVLTAPPLLPCRGVGAQCSTAQQSFLHGTVTAAQVAASWGVNQGLSRSD